MAKFWRMTRLERVMPVAARIIGLAARTLLAKVLRRPNLNRRTSFIAGWDVIKCLFFLVVRTVRDYQREMISSWVLYSLPFVLGFFALINRRKRVVDNDILSWYVKVRLWYACIRNFARKRREWNLWFFFIFLVFRSWPVYPFWIYPPRPSRWIISELLLKPRSRISSATVFWPNLISTPFVPCLTRKVTLRPVSIFVCAMSVPTWVIDTGSANLSVLNSVKSC